MTKEEEKYTTLDTEQCKWWVNTLFSIAKEKACNSHNFDDAEEMQSAQDKIIKALEQQPSNDCERVLNRVMEYTYGMLTTEKIGLQHLIKSMIDELPPVTPTRKSGLRWIERFDNEDKWLECPHCHKDSDNAYAYCPNCGAEMRGIEND